MKAEGLFDKSEIQSAKFETRDKSEARMNPNCLWVLPSCLINDAIAGLIRRMGGCSRRRGLRICGLR